MKAWTTSTGATLVEEDSPRNLAAEGIDFPLPTGAPLKVAPTYRLLDAAGRVRQSYAFREVRDLLDQRARYACLVIGWELRFYVCHETPSGWAPPPNSASNDFVLHRDLKPRPDADWDSIARAIRDHGERSEGELARFSRQAGARRADTIARLPELSGRAGLQAVWRYLRPDGAPPEIDVRLADGTLLLREEAGLAPGRLRYEELEKILAERYAGRLVSFTMRLESELDILDFNGDL